MKPLEDIIEERFVRASGPGGQNVNKVSSAVQLRYPFAQDLRFNDVQRQRLRDCAGSRLVAGDVILIEAKEYRSQEQNRVAARARLQGLLTQAMQAPKRRRATRPTRGSKERRLAAKSNRSTIKQRRGRPGFDD
jgi:ribosome-associated protein